MPTEIMDERKKRLLGIACWAPLIVWILVFGYHLLLFRPQIARLNLESHIDMQTEMAGRFDTLMILYGIAGAITLAVLLLLIVHILKIKNMTMGTKAVWCVVLATFEPIGFVAFWFKVINKEPRQLEVNRTIDG